MPRALCTLALALSWFAGGPALADIVSPSPGQVAVTIYRDPQAASFYDEIEDGDYDISTGLAMVTETRTIEIPAGNSTIVFRGVADAIVPQTAAIDGLPALVLESNFDYDLLSPGTLILKSLGRRVRVVRTDDATGRSTEQHGTLISGPEGVMLGIDGKVEALNCSRASEKLIFDAVPESLISEPTLSVKVKAEQAGSYTIALSYLALGLDWSADYVAQINADGRTLNLTGWLTLVNRGATTFANAPTEVVAGELARTPEETQPPGPSDHIVRPRCWPIGSFANSVVDRISSEDIGRYPDGGAYALQRSYDVEEIAVTGMRGSIQAKLSELGDYKLYTLAEPTTVAARQSKQVRFLSQPKVKFDRLYTYRFDPDEYRSPQDYQPGPVATLRIKNEKRQGLGRPLPSGTMAVLEPAQSPRLVLAGEKELKDTPIGLPFDIELGEAMDVFVETVVTDDETFETEVGDEEQANVEVRFGNDKPVPVVIEFRQAAAEGLRIVRESRKHTMKDGDPMWRLELPAGGRASLSYTVRVAD